MFVSCEWDRESNVIYATVSRAGAAAALVCSGRGRMARMGVLPSPLRACMDAMVLGGAAAAGGRQWQHRGRGCRAHQGGTRAARGARPWCAQVGGQRLPRHGVAAVPVPAGPTRASLPNRQYHHAAYYIT